MGEDLDRRDPLDQERLRHMGDEIWKRIFSTIQYDQDRQFWVGVVSGVRLFDRRFEPRLRLGYENAVRELALRFMREEFPFCFPKNIFQHSPKGEEVERRWSPKREFILHHVRQRSEDEFRSMFSMKGDVPEFAGSFVERYASKIQNQSPLRLCAACGNIPVTPLLLGDLADYAVHVSDIARQDESCGLCRRTQGSLSKLASPPLSGTLEVSMSSNTFRVRCGENEIWSSDMLVDPTSKIDVDVRQGYPAMPSKEARFSLLREWIRDCDGNHGHCDEDQRSLFHDDVRLPKRLIRISGSMGKPKLQLYETGKDERGKYIALSHRWHNPQTQQHSTTLECLDKYKEEIPLDRLLHTFKDAVCVAQAIGLHFLWIDSYCIIQNSDDDWKSECRRMGAYFASAYCTLAATSSTNYEEGLFLERRALRLSDGTSSIYVGDIPENNFDDDVNSANLNTRGWVFQERMLAPRTVHFTKSQMYWECGSAIRCETLNDIDRPFNWLGDSCFPWATNRISSGMSIVVYQDVFSRYSALEFSKQTDRPAALLGLETRLGHFYGTTCTKGILHSRLHESLLWTRAGNEGLVEIFPPGTVQAPSWSWTSYKGQIMFFSSHDDYFHSSGLESTIKGKIKRGTVGVEWGAESVETDNIDQDMVLEAPLKEFGQQWSMERLPNSNYNVVGSGGTALGWIRFDGSIAPGIETSEMRLIRVCQAGSLTRERFGKYDFSEADMCCSVLVVARSQNIGYTCYRRYGVGVVRDDVLHGTGCTETLG
ncbi:hypothetical protein FALCPG4_005513 [Fusarium falciforme]